MCGIPVTDGVTNGTATITSATASFGTDVVGNLVYVQGGTGSVAANWYEIISRTNATTIVVDRTTGLTAGTGVTLNIGGTLATPGAIVSVAGAGGHDYWPKNLVEILRHSDADHDGNSGTWWALLASKLCHVGCGRVYLVRGDRTGNRPIYQWTIAPGSATYAFIPNGNNSQAFINLCVDGNSNANANGFNVSIPRSKAIDCLAKNSPIGFLGAAGHGIRNRSDNCTTGFNGANTWSKCEAIGGTTGFASATSVNKCIARGMASGYTNGGANAFLENCIADSCSVAGFANVGSDLLLCLPGNQLHGERNRV